MAEHIIKNYSQIATTPLREQVLAIAEAGLAAIDTESAILNNIKLEQNRLVIKGQTFDLSKYKNLKVVGFGKASCRAAQALERVLGNLIEQGVALGLAPVACELIKTYHGTHPEPSYENVAVSEQIMQICKDATADDLVIVVVSGGGSALLCWPKQECDQSQILYHQFLRTGGTIQELNSIRKHISLLKGGGLAKFLYPATVIGLIFSDIPGDHLDIIASGPTYLDQTTVSDAEQIIKKYNLPKFDLIETPKDPKYFEKITNIALVTNDLALQAMAKKAEELGFGAHIASDQFYEEAPELLQTMRKLSANKTVVLAGGEPKMKIPAGGGTGGRNLYVSLHALATGSDQEYFLALASDGFDNSGAAGAIADSQSRAKAQAQGIDLTVVIEKFDGYNTFQKLDELIFTGPTEANVSDLFILLRE